MTQETHCPACGAPLVYSGNQDVVRCTFCGTDLKVTREDDQVRFQVLAQPELQKAALDQPVEGAGTGPGGAQVYPEAPAANAYVEEPLPPQPASGGAAIYQVPVGPVGKRGVNRWVWLAIAILLGLGLVCVCAILAVLAVLPGRVH